MLPVHNRQIDALCSKQDYRRENSANVSSILEKLDLNLFLIIRLFGNEKYHSKANKMMVDKELELRQTE